MITLRKSSDRGHADHGWLKALHTFSFANYEDPAHMGFRALRVINEDRVAPGAGFPTHGHRDMEILTWVLEGALQHKDSTGGAGVIRPGELQHMTAGSGVRHSEFNASATDPVHLLQIWIEPDKTGHTPGYSQRTFSSRGVTLVASPDGREGSIRIHQDADMHVARLSAGETAQLELAKDRHAWVQVARGSVALNGLKLAQGDGAAVSGESHLPLKSEGDAEVLVFDLP